MKSFRQGDQDELGGDPTSAVAHSSVEVWIIRGDTYCSDLAGFKETSERRAERKRVERIAHKSKNYGFNAKRNLDDAFLQTTNAPLSRSLHNVPNPLPNKFAQRGTRQMMGTLVHSAGVSSTLTAVVKGMFSHRRSRSSPSSVQSREGVVAGRRWVSLLCLLICVAPPTVIASSAGSTRGKSNTSAGLCDT